MADFSFLYNMKSYLIRKILRKVYHVLFESSKLSSDEYIDRLGGVKVGENVLFRYLEHTLIDTTRPSLVEMGNNLDMNFYHFNPRFRHLCISESIS